MLRKLLKLFFISAVLVALIGCEAYAGGLALSGVGGRAISMGGAFRGVADDWSACYWNPAGLATFEESELNATLTVITPRSEYTPDITLSGYDVLGYKNGTKWYTKDKDFVFPSFSGFFRLPNFKGWTLGVGMYVPFGTGAEWDIMDLPAGYDLNDVYPELNHRSDFYVLDIHPTISRELVEDKLYFGLGASIQKGDIRLRQTSWSFISTELPDNHNKLYTDSDLNGDGWGVGGNAGFLFKMNDRLTVGLAYRSPVTIKLEGTADLYTYTPYDTILARYLYNQGTATDSATALLFQGAVYTASPSAEADLKLPADYGIGISYQFSEKLKLAFDVNYTDWARLDYVPIDLAGNHPLPIFSNIEDDTIYTEWESTVRFSLGLEYIYSEKLAFRLGYFNDPSPIPDETFTPTIPDIGNKNSFNAGFGYDLGTIRIDYNFEYIKFSERNIPASGYTDANNDGEYDNHPGVYNMDLFASFISITHRF
ncbi:MAG: hypothetical protein GF307_12280 [candidate division Zixibacteria bacterium]|nr:hypothetical protein [candidate division Zixibacteria bacterium]